MPKLSYVLILFCLALTPKLTWAQAGANCKDNANRKFHADLVAGLGFNTNPYLLRTEDRESSGSFVFKLMPSLGFEGVGKIATLHLSAAADGALVTGASQATRFMLVDSAVVGKGLLNPGGMVSGVADASVTTNRQVEHLFLGSLTQLKSEFRLGGAIRPENGVITLEAHVLANNETFFDVDQPIRGKYPNDPELLFNDSYYVQGKIVWEFFKDTNLFVDGKWGTWRGKEESRRVSINPLWLNVGVTGIIASNVQGSLSAGYANTNIRLLAPDTLLDGASIAVGMAGDLSWKIKEGSDLYLGLRRDLFPTPIFLEMYKNSAEINFRQKLPKSFALVLGPSFKWYEYGKPLSHDGSRLTGNHRSDAVISVREELTYDLKDCFSVGFSHSGNFRWSNAKDLQVYTLEGKLADQSGTLLSHSSQNEFLLFASLKY